MAAATSLKLCDTNPDAREIAEDNSLLQIDQELDALLEQIEDEIEAHGEASKESMNRLQVFAEAMNIKVDRIGRYLSVMEARAMHCKKEAARLATRAKRAESKIERTKQMVLYYLASHDLTKLESDNIALRRQQNSQDSVIITNADAIPQELRKYELAVEGLLLRRLKEVLPDDLSLDLDHAVKSSQPSNSAIRRHVANGGRVEGAEVKRLCHLRIA